MAWKCHWLRKWAEQTTIHGVKEIAAAPSLFVRVVWMVILGSMFVMVVFQSAKVIADFVDGRAVTHMTVQRFISDDEILRHMEFLYCPNDWMNVTKVKRLNMSEGAFIFAVALFENRRTLNYPGMFRCHSNGGLRYYLSTLNHTWPNGTHSPLEWVNITESLNRCNAAIQAINNPRRFAALAEELRVWMIDHNMSTIQQLMFSVAATHTVWPAITKDFTQRYDLTCQRVGYDTRMLNKELKVSLFRFEHQCGASLQSATTTPYHDNELFDQHDELRDMLEMKRLMHSTSYPHFYISLSQSKLMSRRGAACYTDKNGIVYRSGYSMLNDCYQKCQLNNNCFLAGYVHCINSTLYLNDMEQIVTANQTQLEKYNLLTRIMNRGPCEQQCKHIPDVPCNSLEVKWDTKLMLQTDDAYGFYKCNGTFDRFIDLVHPSGVTIIEETLVMTWSNVIAQFGGLVGLFLGASIVSFVEMALFTIFNCCLCNRKGKFVIDTVCQKKPTTVKCYA